MTKGQAQVEIARYIKHLQGVTAKSSPIHELNIQPVKKSKVDQDFQIFGFQMQEKQRRASNRKGAR